MSDTEKTVPGKEAKTAAVPDTNDMPGAAAIGHPDSGREDASTKGAAKPNASHVPSGVPDDTPHDGGSKARHDAGAVGNASPAVLERHMPRKEPGLVIEMKAKSGQKAKSESSPSKLLSKLKILCRQHAVICSVAFVLVLGGCAALVYNANTSSYVVHDANPYKGYNTLAIVVGDQFASLGTYEDKSGQRQDADGIVVKVEPDGTVNLPLVQAKPGYTFMGWSQGGVKTGDDIDVTPDTTEIEMTADRHGYTRLYALFADSAGNGYCSCGDYQAGAYKDALKK